MESVKLRITLAAVILLAVWSASVQFAQLGAQTLQAGSFSVSIEDVSLVAPEEVPEDGTFWMLTDCLRWGANAPPYPFNPYPQTPVFWFGLDGVFLVDDSSVNTNAIPVSQEQETPDGATEPVVEQPVDQAAFYSNNLASVSRWLHRGMTNEDGTPADFQTMMNNRTKAFATNAAEFVEEQISAASSAWIRATNMGMPTVMKSASGAIAVLRSFVDGVPIYDVGLNVESAQTISTTAVQPGGSTGLDLTGTNRTIYMWDTTSPRTTHVEFGGRVSLIDSQSGDPIHATEVAGCLAAGGVNPAAQGMSYQANVLSGVTSHDVPDMIAAISTNNMRLSNHSYGRVLGWWHSGDGSWGWYGYSEIDTNEDPKFGLYSQVTSNIDVISYNALQYLGVWAAGNSRSNGPPYQPILHWEHTVDNYLFQTNRYHPWDGYVTGGYDTLSEQACAKNVLTVGAVYPLTNGYGGPGSVILAPFSSCGPTDDGRIKPDLVAAGVNIFTTTVSNDTAYTSFSGTSIAAPAVTGSINLLAQLYSQLHLNADDLLGSTYKALVIQTADQCGTNAGPSYQVGWGLMDTAQAASLMCQDATNGLKNFIKEVLLDDGTLIEFPVASTGGTNSPLKVTIAWTDPPGIGNAQTNLNNPTTKLINDLDLRVVDPSGVTNFPYLLNPDFTNRSASVRALPATTGDNTRDNVEQVCIMSPTAGTYTVSVTHKGVLQGGSQWVSILLSGNAPYPQSQEDFRINTFVQTSTNSMAIGWAAVVGQKYQVEYVNCLESNNWQPVGGEISARLTNVVTQVTYDNTAPSTFYRVAQIP